MQSKPGAAFLRYGPKRNGYHGGITPSEMLAPIAVLASASMCPAGWQVAALELPTWWQTTALSALATAVEKNRSRLNKSRLALFFAMH